MKKLLLILLLFTFFQCKAQDYIDWVGSSIDACAVDLSNGLIAYYNFNETSGDLIDRVGDYDFTVNSVTRGESGIDGSNCYYFNGTSDYLSIASSPLQQAGVGDTITFAVWVKTETLSSMHYIWNSRPLTNDLVGISLYTNNNGFWGGFTTYGTGGYKACVYGTTNTWYLLWVRIWIDSNSDAHYQSTANDINTWGSVGTGSGTYTTFSNATVTIGRYNSSSLFFWKGWIDDIKIWNRDLTYEERLCNYKNGNGKELTL